MATRSREREVVADPDAVAETAHAQHLWDVRYVDALVLRWRDADGSGDGTLEETLYATHDANFNVTALVGPDGTVVERYAYDPYGQVIVLNGAADPDGQEWTPDPGNASDVSSEVLYAGYRFDPETGLYHVRHRSYHPTLGRWTSRDPAGYVDAMNLYEYCRSGPHNSLDPFGAWRLEGSYRQGYFAIAEKGDTLSGLAAILGTDYEHFGYEGDPASMPVGTEIDVTDWVRPPITDLKSYRSHWIGWARSVKDIIQYCSSDDQEAVVLLQDWLANMSRWQETLDLRPRVEFADVLEYVNAITLSGALTYTLGTGTWRGLELLAAEQSQVGRFMTRVAAGPLGKAGHAAGVGLTLFSVALDAYAAVEYTQAGQTGMAANHAIVGGLGLASLIAWPLAIPTVLGAGANAYGDWRLHKTANEIREINGVLAKRRYVIYRGLFADRLQEASSALRILANFTVIRVEE